MKIICLAGAIFSIMAGIQAAPTTGTAIGDDRVHMDQIVRAKFEPYRRFNARAEEANDIGDINDIEDDIDDEAEVIAKREVEEVDDEFEDVGAVEKRHKGGPSVRVKYPLRFPGRYRPH